MEISLRPTRQGDREFVWQLHRTTLGPCVAAAFGWDDDEQRALFDAKYTRGRGRIIEVDGRPAGYRRRRGLRLAAPPSPRPLITP